MKRRPNRNNVNASGPVLTPELNASAIMQTQVWNKIKSKLGDTPVKLLWTSNY